MIVNSAASALEYIRDWDRPPASVEGNIRRFTRAAAERRGLAAYHERIGAVTARDDMLAAADALDAAAERLSRSLDANP